MIGTRSCVFEAGELLCLVFFFLPSRGGFGWLAGVGRRSRAFVWSWLRDTKYITDAAWNWTNQKTRLLVRVVGDVRSSCELP